MTREQKAKVIRDYCGEHECCDCVINRLSQHKTGHCYTEATDEEIDMNYKAVCEDLHIVPEDDVEVDEKDNEVVITIKCPKDVNMVNIGNISIEL